MTVMTGWGLFEDSRAAQDGTLAAMVRGWRDGQQQDGGTGAAGVCASRREPSARAGAASPCPATYRRTRSRPPHTTAFSWSWCPRDSKPGPSASRCGAASRRGPGADREGRRQLTASAHHRCRGPQGSLHYKRLHGSTQDCPGGSVTTFRAAPDTAADPEMRPEADTCADALR
jgi:hypothetical protein